MDLSASSGSSDRDGGPRGGPITARARALEQPPGRVPGGIVASLFAGIAIAAALGGAARAADPLLVIAEGGDAEALPLPSVARRLESFEQVSAAIGDERKRLAALESRLVELEKKAAPGVEPLPPPAATAGQPATAASGTPQDGTGNKDRAAGKIAAPADEPYEVGTDLGLPTKWDSGLEAASGHKDFRVKIGGRTQVDAVAFSSTQGPAQGPDQGGLDPALADTVNMRRARFRIEGRMYEMYDWACEYDFVNQLNVNNAVYPTERDAGPLTAVTDLWLQVRELPVLGTVRVGSQKDPFGYEHLTSSRWLNFMERSFAQDAFEGPFNNGFVPGIQALNSNEEGDIGWQVGEFKNTTNPFAFSNTSGGSMTVGRLVYLPVFEDEGRKLVHLAVSGRTMEPKRQFLRFDQATGQGLGDPVTSVRFRSRGDIRNGPPGPLNSIYADSGLLAGTWQNMIGLELVGNNGPWSFQSEYFGSWLYNAKTTSAGPLVTNGFQPKPGTNVGTVYYQAGYAEVLYFLTGESRTYSKIEYRFDRPVPHNNFYAIRGGGSGRRISVSEGAWQVGARYNYLCLNDSGVNGGVLNGVTLGLNWLLNPNARIYFNYDITHRDFVSTPWTKDDKGQVVPSTSYDGSGWISGFGTRLAFDF
jgi:phosphate-selective porin OprO/OprP